VAIHGNTGGDPDTENDNKKNNSARVRAVTTVLTTVTIVRTVTTVTKILPITISSRQKMAGVGEMNS